MGPPPHPPRQGVPRRPRLVAHVRCTMNGIGLAPSARVCSMPPLYTDASGSWGCGASWNQHWFQLKWDVRSQSLPIPVKEMLPIIISAAIWGPQWRAAKRITCCCDNAAVVAALSSRSCKVDHIMHLMRCLFYVEAFHELRSISALLNATSSGEAPIYTLARQATSSVLWRRPSHSQQ